MRPLGLALLQRPLTPDAARALDVAGGPDTLPSVDDEPAPVPADVARLMSH
jgi:hypothetical protein